MKTIATNVVKQYRAHDTVPTRIGPMYSQCSLQN